MLYIFLMAALVIAGVVTTLMAKADGNYGYGRTAEEVEAFEARMRAETRSRRIMAAVSFTVVAAVTTLGFSVKTVDAGTVAVVYQFGEIIGQEPEGLQFVAPWQTTRRESIKVQRVQFEDMATFSSETQDVFLTVTLNYSVSPEAVQQLYREVGPSWFEVLIAPRVNNFLKGEVVKYETVQVAPNREQIRADAEAAMARDLAPFSITVNDLLIDNIRFDPEYIAAIERKQIATQEAQTEANRIEAERNRAEQRVVEAEGDARAEIIRAEAQAQANRLVAESLTPEVLQYRAIEKLGDDIEIALIPSGQGLILDPATLLGGSTNSTADANE